MESFGSNEYVRIVIKTVVAVKVRLKWNLLTMKYPLYRNGVSNK
jgi:hypothetical protein